VLGHRHSIPTPRKAINKCHEISFVPPEVLAVYF
jgi:hypothetical protein